jgi:phosphate transport system permease protein
MKKIRIIEEYFFKALMIASTIIVLFSLLFIIVTVLIKGLPSFNLDMITKTPKGGFYLGKEGGILNAIIGSLYLAAGSTLLAIFISIPVTLFLNIYTKRKSILSNFLRFSFEILTGIPSIVYGAFGLIVMQYFGLRTSLLAGIIVVAILILPIMVRGIDEVMEHLPPELLESSFALGSTKFETSFKVVLRQILPGIITSILLSFGRGIGDAASVLFTSGFSDNIPTSLEDPVATLPLAIFFQLSSPIKEVQNRAYSAALILTVIILIVSISARYISKRFNKFKIK